MKEEMSKTDDTSSSATSATSTSYVHQDVDDGIDRSPIRTSSSSSTVEEEEEEEKDQSFATSVGDHIASFSERLGSLGYK